VANASESLLHPDRDASMTTATLATARKVNGQIGQSHEQENEEWQNTQSEILPDTVAEILRRMQEEFKCPIWYVLLY
jgi:hypothetical protein